MCNVGSAGAGKNIFERARIAKGQAQTPAAQKQAAETVSGFVPQSPIGGVARPINSNTPGVSGTGLQIRGR
jgi:hypothetical protein